MGRPAAIGRSGAVGIGFALLAAACINIAAGVTLALADPRRAADLRVMYEWCRGWLIDGQSLYTAADAATDYPPNAIVLLAPLAFAPARWLVLLWVAGAVALTPVLPWLVVRAAAGPDRGRRDLVVPVLLYLCWAAPRTLLQFSLLSMTLACVALVAADRRWIAGGVALGLALIKPHLAGPIALWMLATGRLRPLAAAAAVVLGGWAVYDARIGESPLTTVTAYWRVLGSQYAGPGGLVGLTGIRGLTRLAVSDSANADVLWLALSALPSSCSACWRRAIDRALDRGAGDSGDVLPLVAPHDLPHRQQPDPDAAGLRVPVVPG